MAEKMVSPRSAVERIENASTKNHDWVSDSLVGEGESIRESELRTVTNSLRKCGDFGVDLLQHSEFFSAYDQLLKKPFSKTPEQANRLLLAQFAPQLARVTQTPGLRKHGFSFRIDESIDPPFKVVLEVKHGVSPVFELNFDLHYNSKGRPSVVLGSGQGRSIEAVELFRRSMGRMPLNYFYSSFIRAFGGQDQVKALNVKHHAYRHKKNMSKEAIAHTLYDRDVITHAEWGAYVGWVNGRSKINKDVRRVNWFVEREIPQIVRRATGMHKSALKKAGFRTTSKSRFYRLKK